MRKLFKLKLVKSSRERTVGFIWRIFGLDFSILLLGFLDDWRIIDLRISFKAGIFCQIWFLFLGIGAMPDAFYEHEG